MSSSISFPTYQAVAVSSSSESAIQKTSKASLKFHYQAVSYEDFSKAHSSRGSLQRKIIAIPSALMSGIVKTIYHLTLAIFEMPTSLMGFTEGFQIQAYALIRDVQETLGWITTLFHDDLGAYLVEESLFQKNCYSTFEESKFHFTKSYNRSWSNGVQIPFYDQAIKIDLQQFQKMNEEDQKDTIEKFDLTEEIEALGGEQFFQKLKSSNPEALKLVTLVDLKQPSIISKIKYAILPDAEFCKLTISQIQRASPEQLHLLSKRLEVTSILTGLKPSTCKNILETPLVQFHLVPSKKINESIKEIPANAFLFLKDDQLKELNFTNIPNEGIHILFKYVDGKKEKERFAKLSASQVQGILSKLGDYQLSLLSDEQLTDLDFKDISSSTFSNLFKYVNGVDEKKRFALLSASQVQEILPKLRDYQLNLLSDEQLTDLDFKDLSSNTISTIFRYVNGGDEKRRFALLSASQVQEILPKLRDYQLSLLSDEQLTDLDFKDLSSSTISIIFRHVNGVEEKRRFALLSLSQVQEMLPKLGDYQLRLISDEQLKKLDLKDLSTGRISSILPFINGKEEKTRLALLSLSQVQELLPKFGDEQLRYISDEQLKKLKFKDLPTNRFQALFSYIKTAEKKERFACIQDINSVIEKLSNDQMGILSDAQIKQLNVEKLTQTQIDAFFPNSRSKESILKEHTYISYNYISSDRAEKKVNTSISEADAERISKESQEKLLGKWALLSNSQKRHIHSKLSLENQSLLSV